MMPEHGNRIEWVEDYGGLLEDKKWNQETELLGNVQIPASSIPSARMKIAPDSYQGNY